MTEPHPSSSPVDDAFIATGLAAVRSGEKSTVFHAVIRPDIETIAALRGLMLKVTEQLGATADVSSRAALALHELLENSLKYSSDGVAGVTVTLSRTQPAELAIVIKVTNQVSLERLAGLAAVLEQLSGAADPKALYQAMMHRTSRLEGGSGLGLARILAEAEMTLEGEIVGEVVSLVAGLRAPVA